MAYDTENQEAYVARVDQPEEDEGCSNTEEGKDISDAAGISQCVTLAYEVVVDQEIGRDDGVEDPDEGDGQGGNDIPILDDFVQTKSCSMLESIRSTISRF